MSEYGWAIKDRHGRILSIRGPVVFEKLKKRKNVWWFMDKPSALRNVIACLGERVVKLNKETLEEYVGE